MIEFRTIQQHSMKKSVYLLIRKYGVYTNISSDVQQARTQTITRKSYLHQYGLFQTVKTHPTHKT